MGGLVLAVTGIAKVLSAFGKAKLLDYHDPVTQISFRHLFLLAAIVEVAVALFCLLSNKPILGTKLIAWLATVFIGYRVGLWLVHWRSPCACLGTLTDALHIPPAVVDSVMKAILGFLAFGSCFVLICKRRARSSTVRSSRITVANPLKLALVACCSLIWQRLLYGEQAIEIHGTYEVSMFYPPKKTQLSASFAVVLDGKAWSIAATNNADAADWDMLVFDGTNAICFSPTNRVMWRSLPALKDLVFVSISRHYDEAVQSSVKLYIPWITYGLCPTNVGRNEAGLIDLPPPWMLPRRHLGAFGWKWTVEPASDGRFVDRCVVMRDSALDCRNERDELLRPGFDCPVNLDRFDEVKADIRRRKEVPDGFINCNYACTKYSNVAGIRIPVEATVSNFRPEPDGSGREIQKAILRANTFTVYDHPTSLLPGRTGPVLVQDYRYRKRRGDRVFQFAEYVLQPSNPWMGPDNVELKKKADDFVRFGRKFDDFGVWYSLSAKSLVRWLILLAALLPPCVILWRSRNKVHR